MRSLERLMIKLFESNGNVASLPTGKPGATKMFYQTPYVQYKQLKLQELFKHYLETVILLKKNFEQVYNRRFFKKRTKYCLVRTHCRFHRSEETVRLARNIVGVRY